MNSSKNTNSTHRVTRVNRNMHVYNGYICLLRLTESKGLQTLTGHTGLLKFRYTNNKRES